MADEKLEAPNQQGLDLFEKASTAVFELEQFLRLREHAQACAPFYRMRIGINDLLQHYVANRTVCDKATIHEMCIGGR